MEKPQALGERIAQARREMGVRVRRDISQTDVAAAIGVSGASVSQWESGLKSPREDTLAKLADYLGVTPAFLRYGVGEADVQPIARPTHHEGVRREDGDAVRERQQAKRNAAKKAVAGGQPHPARPAKPR